MLQPGLKEDCEAITSVVSDWLVAEVASSSDPADVNAVLDNYEDAIEGLTGGFEHRNNFAWNKHNSHMTRLSIDVNALKDTKPEDSDFDSFASKVTFDGLMEVSGSYRIQCYIEAGNQQEYTSQRRQAIAINIGSVVQNSLISLIPVDLGLTDARISVEGLANQKEQLIEQDTDNIKRMISIMTLGEDSARAAGEMVNSQYAYLKFVTDCIILIAKFKDGNLAEVPFLEPRSITEQSGKLHYPLHEPVDWAEILAA